MNSDVHFLFDCWLVEIVVNGDVTGWFLHFLRTGKKLKFNTTKERTRGNDWFIHICCLYSWQIYDRLEGCCVMCFKACNFRNVWIVIREWILLRVSYFCNVTTKNAASLIQLGVGTICFPSEWVLNLHFIPTCFCW